MTPRNGQGLQRLLRRRSRQTQRNFPLLLAATVLVGACSQDPPSTHLVKDGSTPDQILWDFTTSASDSGQLRWTFSGDRALIFKKGREVQATGIQLDMYTRAQELSSTLTSDSGLIDRRRGNMTALGNVHVISREDYQLWTDTLHWDQDRELFHTKAFVEVQKGRNLYSGYDMECDQELDHLTILREFKALVVQEEVDDE
jgi:LPS export ABC transporter protein LptC